MLIESLFTNYLENVRATSSLENYRFNHQNCLVMGYFFSSQKITFTYDLNIDVMYKLIEYLKNRKNCTNSINKKIGTLKRALKFNSIEVSGVSNFKKIKTIVKRLEIVTKHDLMLSLKYLSQLDNSPVSLTKKIVFYLFLYTGMRAKELLNVEIRNIDLINKTILLTQTKSKRTRFVFFHKSIVENLKKYIELKDRQFLFYNFRINKRLNHMHLRTIFHYIEIESGAKRLRPHMLRHTMATLLVENNAPLYTIKEILGHESITTTQIYLHLSTKKLQSDYDTYFPNIKA